MEHIQSERNGNLSILTLSRGKANALNYALVEELCGAVAAAAADDSIRGLVPVGVMPAKPERLGNVEVRQGDILAVLGALAHTIHKDGGGLRWQPLHDARHMVPASVGDAGFGKGTAPPASVRELQRRAALVSEDQIAERLMPALIHDTGRARGLFGANPQLDGEVVLGAGAK